MRTTIPREGARRPHVRTAIALGLLGALGAGGCWVAPEEGCDEILKRELFHEDGSSNGYCAGT